MIRTPLLPVMHSYARLMMPLRKPVGMSVTPFCAAAETSHPHGARAAIPITRLADAPRSLPDLSSPVGVALALTSKPSDPSPGQRHIILRKQLAEPSFPRRLNLAPVHLWSSSATARRQSRCVTWLTQIAASQ